jgi:hypothetical protein
MAANLSPFVCLQCAYGADNRARMMSHINYKHTLVQPWECAQPGCTVTCPRRYAIP